MEPLDINPGNRLRWSQPKALQRTFELRDGNRHGSVALLCDRRRHYELGCRVVRSIR